MSDANKVDAAIEHQEVLDNRAIKVLLDTGLAAQTAWSVIGALADRGMTIVLHTLLRNGAMVHTNSNLKRPIDALQSMGFTQEAALSMIGKLNRAGLYIADDGENSGFVPAEEYADKHPYVSEDVSPTKFISYTISVQVPATDYLGAEAAYNAMSSAHRDLVIANNTDATFSVHTVED